MATEKAIPHLHRSRIAQMAIAETFTTHRVTTPPGDYRKILEAHRLQARVHGWLVNARWRQLDAHGDLAQQGLRTAQLRTHEVITAARLLPVALRGTGGLIRRNGEERTLWARFPSQCALSAHALATYRVLEQVAWSLEDEETARLPPC
jgi:hypothetical protein